MAPDSHISPDQQRAPSPGYSAMPRWPRLSPSRDASVPDETYGGATMRPAGGVPCLTVPHTHARIP